MHFTAHERNTQSKDSINFLEITFEIRNYIANYRPTVYQSLRFTLESI